MPLQEEIGKALEAFAKARGINVIIDAAQVPLLYAAESIDITKAFITDFNSKNPVTAVDCYAAGIISFYCRLPIADFRFHQLAIANWQSAILIHGNSPRFTGNPKTSAASLSLSFWSIASSSLYPAKGLLESSR